MPNTDEKIFRELENISFLLADLSSIRHGEYEPPRGSDPDSTRPPLATIDDLCQHLSAIFGLLERQNSLIYDLGQAIRRIDDVDYDAAPEHLRNVSS